MNDNIVKRYASEDYVDKKIVQPDWNQNDPTAPDYVKNRPFWTGDPVETELIAETTNEWLALGFGGVLILNPIEITEGTTYKINWDGTLYECIAGIAEKVGAPSIGNATIAGAGSMSNNEPFFITVLDSSTFVFAGSVGSHTFDVWGAAPQVHKIDEKYLPDTIMKSNYQKYTVAYIDFLKVLHDYGIYIKLKEDSGNAQEWAITTKKWESFLDLLDEFNSNNSVCMEQGLPVSGVKSNGGTPVFVIYDHSFSSSGNLYLKKYEVVFSYNAETQILTITRTINTKTLE